MADLKAEKTADSMVVPMAVTTAELSAASMVAPTAAQKVASTVEKTDAR